jgi:hypothetical protein
MEDNLLEQSARDTGQLLDRRDLSRREFEELYTQWHNKSFDWRVHLGLIMSPMITADEFLHLARKYCSHNIMCEEVMAQMGRFKFKSAIRKELLSKFLPQDDKRSSVHAVSWNTLERIAVSKLQK